MAFVAGQGRTGLGQEKTEGDAGALEITAAGSAQSITVSVFYPHASDGDVCRVAVYPRGAEKPIAVFGHPAPLAEGRIELSAEDPSAAHTFTDLHTGEYDVYYHCRTSRGDATEWTNVVLNGILPAAGPVRASVGMITPQSVTGSAGFFGGPGTSVQLPPRD
ncbi:hypothetical protein [Tomitella biformata]|uniref:hypothetical protein n=1 Tax=Tomitella biformata TaxID=630403 RepID=UPI0004678A5E|nr:hypothetical protein [Tomitella biformata]